MPLRHDSSDHSLAKVFAVLRQKALDLTDIRRVVANLRARQVALEVENRELRLAQRTLRETRDHYASLYDLAPVAYATLDREGRVTELNLTAAHLLGIERDQTPGLLLGPRLTPGGSWLLLAALTRVLETGLPESITVGLGSDRERLRDLRLVIQQTPQHPGRTGPATCRVALLDDTEQQRLTEQLRERERELVQLAHHDSLTALPNLVLLTDRVGQSLRQAHRQQRQAALLLVDLDGFKTINDSLGHAAGDRVLREAARRLRCTVREDDTVARVGGDEFTVVLGSLERGGDAAVVAEKLLRAFKQPIELDGRALYITASIGISLYPRDGTNADTLLYNAEAAMYQAKDQGRDTFRFYTQDLTTRAVAQASVETALRQALAKGEFVLHYQPQHDLTTGRIIGVEALIRWEHPVQGLLGPEAFIPVAESSGLIVPIGAWVVRTAAAQLRAWRELGLLAAATMWVNLSNREIRTANLAARIAATIAGVRLEPGALAVEICDLKALADSASATENIRHLTDLGIEVAIDDFGTGQSPLASLRRLAVRALKIDGSFVAGLPGNLNDDAMVRAIIYLGQTLGLRVVAEGIETSAQAAALTAAGCRIGQGYLFSRPLPAAEFEVYCRGDAAAPAAD